MSKTAFIYPGQGAQKAGMGADFYENSEIARYIFDQAGEELGLDMKALCFEENDKLDLTEYTQAAMVTTCLAMTRVAENKGLKADVTAGLSLGEYPAIAIAGGMNDMDAIRLVRKRGILMQNTVPAGEGAMCAVISMDAEKIEEVIEPIADVSVANYNCPGQISCAGSADEIDAFCAAIKEKGGRAVKLAVSGAFHTPYMKDASEELEKALKAMTINAPQTEIYANRTGKPYPQDTAQIIETIALQASSSVRFEDTLKNMWADGIDTFIEVGAGKTLTGFVKKTLPEAKMYTVTTVDALNEAIENIKAGE